jgi:hypothetical protein
VQKKFFYLKSKLFFITGLALSNYLTLSQKYNISYQGTPPYDVNKTRLFGHSLNLDFSLLKQYHKIQIGPTIILPVFACWKKDNVFEGEVSTEYRSKWFNGIGLGISCNLSVNKKK